MKRALATALLGAAACASYGWADRPAAVRVERPVTVRTVDVDAHAGTDAAALTRALVAELHRAGIATAAWSGVEADRDVVECDVALIDDVGFGEQSFVKVSTRCLVDGAVVTTRLGDAQVALQPDDRTSGRRTAAETAARASFPDVAHDLADHLSKAQ